MKQLITSLLLLLLATPVWAALNKWVDSEGKVHYSDSAPPDAKSTKVRTYSPGNDDTQPTPAPAKSLAEREKDLKKKEQENQKEEQKAKQAKEAEDAKKQNCENARRNLSTLENSPRISSYSETGERVIMSDDARNQHTQEARQAIEKYCK